MTLQRWITMVSGLLFALVLTTGDSARAQWGFSGTSGFASAGQFGLGYGLSRKSRLSATAHGRLFRPGKATISAELAGIFDRLGTNARSWQVKMKKLRASRLFGRVFAASQAKLEEIAERLGVRYVVNLARCPAR
jgi:hypothetical protein